MTTTNMADLFSAAEAAGFSSKDLDAGEYDAVVTRTQVRDAKNPGVQRLLVTFKEVGGDGTVLASQQFDPSNTGSHFYWFRFLAQFGLDGAFWRANPGITVEQIATLIQSQAQQGAAYRIEVKDRPSGDKVYKDVDVIGPATGQAPVTAAPAPKAPAPPAPAVAAPAPPWSAS